MDGPPPKRKTRLDLLVQLREREEEAARLEFAKAAAAVQRARALETALRERAAKERDLGRPSGADEWEIVEASQRRAAVAIEAAAQKTREAVEAERKARAILDEAHRAAEAMRRAAEAKREELRLEEERQERKELDALGQLLHGFRRRKGEGDR